MPESNHYWKKDIAAVTVRTVDGEIITFSTDEEGETIRKIKQGFIRQMSNRNNEPRMVDRMEWYEIDIHLSTERQPETIDT